MPKPKSKIDLVELSQSNFEKLMKLVNSFSDEEVNKEFPKGTLNRNIKDVLAHLHHWHLMMSDWYKVGMNGGKPDMPAKGYTWKTLPSLNKKIWEMYQEVELDAIKKDLQISYAHTQELINSHNEEELFDKQRYKWTGTTSLGVYLISNTSSHYDWAIKLIKKSMK